MDLTAYWRENISINPDLQVKLILTAAGFSLLWLAWRLVCLAGYRYVHDVRVRYRMTRSFSLLAMLLGTILFWLVWAETLKSIMTFLGLFSAGVAFALKDAVMNAFGSLFILWRRPFDVGDRIEIGGLAGDVIDTRVFHFTLLEIGKWVDEGQSTGRIILIPNGKVFTEPLANYSQGFQFIWNEIAVPVTFDSDWRKAKGLLLQIANRHTEQLGEEAAQGVRKASQKYMIYFSKLTPAVYTAVKESGIVLTVRYLCRPQRRRDSVQAIWESILSEFAAHPGIALAYAPAGVGLPVDGVESGWPGPEDEGATGEDGEMPGGGKN